MKEPPVWTFGRLDASQISAVLKVLTRRASEARIRTIKDNRYAPPFVKLEIRHDSPTDC
jgi:hypothetical protein